MTQEDFEIKLSFVSLDDDNRTVMLNGEAQYSFKLPASITKKNNAADKRKMVEKSIFDACHNFAIDYVSEDNVKSRTKEIVDQIYERARVSNKNYVSEPMHPIIANHYHNNYFEFLIDCNKKTVKRESALIRQINLTELSAYGNDPMNLAVIAPTSTGKTYPIMEAAKFTPLGKEVRIVGSMTPKVLIREQGFLVDKNGNPIGKDVRRLKNAIAQAKAKKHFDAAEEYHDELAALLEDSAYILELSGKTLIFLEPPRPELWDLMKPILSHDYWEMEHPFVDKVASGGLEVKGVITRGWPACIVCSAKDESKWEMWPEIESRFQVVSPNMVKPKYQAGNKLIAQKKGLPRGVKQQLIISDTEKELGKKAFLYLKYQIQQLTSTTDSPVWIPFGERIAEILPAEKGQDNRAANRFFTILNIVTLSKAHLRHKLLFDDEELVIATLDDLRETLHVMQNVTGMPPHKLKFYQQHILPLYKAKNKTKLETKDICDYYNVNTPKDTLKMNSDNLRKNYLQELVNHNYLEQEQDENTKATKYLFTPLVDIEDEYEGQEEQAEEEESPTSTTLGQVFENLHFSKLLLPKDHQGFPSDWLNQEILQLSDRRLTQAPLKILEPKGNDVPIDVFVRLYEPSSSVSGLKIMDFFKVHRLVGNSNSANSTTSEPQKGDSNVNSTENEEQKEEKSKTQPKVGEVGDFEAMIKEVLAGRDYFTDQEWMTKLMFLPVQDPCKCDQDQAMQVLRALIEDGKLQQIGSDRFKPVNSTSKKKQASKLSATLKYK